MILKGRLEKGLTIEKKEKNKKEILASSINIFQENNNGHS